MAAASIFEDAVVCNSDPTGLRMARDGHRRPSTVSYRRRWAYSHDGAEDKRRRLHQVLSGGRPQRLARRQNSYRMVSTAAAGTLRKIQHPPERPEDNPKAHPIRSIPHALNWRLPAAWSSSVPMPTIGRAIRPLMHRAFIHFANLLKPKIIVMNGDAFIDGALISRHPPIWMDASPPQCSRKSKPVRIGSTKLRRCTERLQEDLELKPRPASNAHRYRRARTGEGERHQPANDHFRLAAVLVTR